MHVHWSKFFRTDSVYTDFVIHLFWLICYARAEERKDVHLLKQKMQSGMFSVLSIPLTLTMWLSCDWACDTLCFFPFHKVTVERIEKKHSLTEICIKFCVLWPLCDTSHSSYLWVSEVQLAKCSALRFNAVQLSTLSKTYLRKILPCGAQYIPCNFCETFIFFFPSKNDFNFSPKTAITTNCVEQWINW